MPNANKRKGDQFERDVVKYLQAQKLVAARRYGAGRPDDIGDIWLPDVSILQCKNHKTFALSTWVNELEEQVSRDNFTSGAVVAKRRNRNIKDSYVIMPLHWYASLIKKVVDNG